MKHVFRATIILTFFLGLVSGSVRGGLPNVRRPPSAEFKPVKTLTFYKNRLPDGCRLENGGTFSNETLALKDGQKFVMNTPSGSREKGTVVIWVKFDTPFKGCLFTINFANTEAPLAFTANIKGDKGRMWFTKVPLADGKSIVGGREDVYRNRWLMIAIEYGSDAVGLYLNKKRCGWVKNARKIQLPAQMSITSSKQPFKIAAVEFYDSYLDHNDLLKVYYSKNSKALSIMGKLATDNKNFTKGEKHPRLFASRKTIDEIKKSLGDSDYANLLEHMKRHYDDDISKGPLLPERIGEIKRGEGDAIGMLAALYTFTGDKKYLRQAEKYIDAVANYKIWDKSSPGWTNNDLVTGHLLSGLALAYDWLYDDLSKEYRKKIEICVDYHANDCAFRAAVGNWTWGRDLRNNAQWAKGMSNNHGVVTLTGLLTASVAFDGKLPHTNFWANVAMAWFRRYKEALSLDGSYHEGIGYLYYNINSLLRAADIARKYFNFNFYDTNFMRNCMKFDILSRIPAKYWEIRKYKKYQRLFTSIMSFGDTRQRDFIVPYLFAWKFASEYNDPHYMYFGNQLARADNYLRRSNQLLLVYLHDAKKSGVKPEKPQYDDFEHFDDGGITFMRSDKEGVESVLIFRCGPPTGHKNLAKYNEHGCGGHVSAEVGAFTLFAAGELMIINSDYSFKLTSQENTITVNGIGQVGDNVKWYGTSYYYKGKLNPKIIHTDSTENFAYVVGDATAAYRPEARLKKFQRHILWLKPQVWIIADDLEAETASTFEARFNSLQTAWASEDGKFAKLKSNQKSGILDFINLNADNASLKASVYDLRLIDGHSTRKTNLITLTNPQKTDKKLFVTVLGASQNADDKISAKMENDIITISKDGKTYKVKILKHSDNTIRLKVI